MAFSVVLCFALVSLAIFAVGAVHDDRRRRKPRRRVELPLLHSINDDRCIGCEACVDVCPTKVLDLVEHKAKVVNFQDCVQCEQCVWSCPTTALVMYRQGSQPRTLTVPELDEHFQTAVPGQYLIGEVAGKPLVKNAANLGRAVIEQVRRSGLSPGGGGAGVVDVVIVGSGPGGLSAGLACLKYGLSYVILEKEHVVASTVARYPKGKSFMAEPAGGDNLSFLPVFDATKEELVAAWGAMVKELGLPVRMGEAVEGIKRGDDGVFAVKTTVATHRAQRVVLATGLRGKPRLLAVPGANLPKVHAMLEDAAEHAGQTVLVIGGGDSALEAAMSLSDAGAQVTLSYRGDSLKRAKPGNQKRIAEYAQSQRLELVLGSEPSAFTETEVTLKLTDGSERVIGNQQAFVMIGAEPPVEWLQKLGVRFVERPHTYQLGTTDALVRAVAPDAQACPSDPREALARLRGEAPRPKRARTLGEVVEDQISHVRTAVELLVGHRRTGVSVVAPLPSGPQRGASVAAPLPASPQRGVDVVAPVPVSRARLAPGTVIGRAEASGFASGTNPPPLPVRRPIVQAALPRPLPPASPRPLPPAIPRVAPPTRLGFISEPLPSLHGSSVAARRLAHGSDRVERRGERQVDDFGHEATDVQPTAVDDTWFAEVDSAVSRLGR